LKARQNAKETRKCLLCGNEFIAIAPNKIYCSKKCYIRVKNNKKLKQVEKIRECKYYRKIFTANAFNQKYCCKICAKMSYNANQKILKTMRYTPNL